MKKRLCLILCGVLLLFGRPVIAAAALEKISESVYSYVGAEDASAANSFGANAGIVIGPEGVLVVDTLISAQEADRFITDIRKVTDKPIKYVVNTHCHLDHAFGNSEFAKLGAIIISHQNDKAQLASLGERELKNIKDYGLTEEEMSGTKIALPAITFKERMNIDLGGGVTVALIHPGPSHSQGSILVFIPKESVLFAGDILFTDFHPYMADGDVPSWVKALNFIQTLDAACIIPGHGPLSGKKDILEMLSYLKDFDMKAKRLAARSQDPEIIAATLKKELPSRRQLDWVIIENVKGKYLKGKK